MGNRKCGDEDAAVDRSNASGGSNAVGNAVKVIVEQQTVPQLCWLVEMRKARSRLLQEQIEQQQSQHQQQLASLNKTYNDMSAC